MPKVRICAAKGVVSQRVATQLTLHFSNRKKRMREIQKKIKTGKINVREDDPLEMFVSSTDIRYCYYNETHKILGNTYGMCILQVCAQLCLLLEKHFCNVHLNIKQDFVMCGCWQDYVSGILLITLTSYKSSPNRASGRYFMQML